MALSRVRSPSNSFHATTTSDPAATTSACAAAAPAWAATPALRRARVLFRFKELLEANFDALAKIITREHGKTLSDAKGELARGLEIVESRSSRPRNYTNLLSVKLSTPEGEQWVEGAVFERTPPRLVLVNGIGIDAPLDGTMVVVEGGRALVGGDVADVEVTSAIQNPSGKMIFARIPAISR